MSLLIVSSFGNGLFFAIRCTPITWNGAKGVVTLFVA